MTSMDFETDSNQQKPNVNQINRTLGSNQVNGSQQGFSQAEAPDFMTLARRATVATAMSVDGTKYVEQLKTYLKDKDTLLSNPIEVYSLPYPSESLAVCSGDEAFILLFSEATHREDNYPTVGQVRSALQTLKSINDKAHMLSTIVISPSDYDRPQVMGAFMINALAGSTNTAMRSMNIESLKRYQIEISTNVNTYLEFNRKYDPHGTEARADLKLTFVLCQQRSPNTGGFFERYEYDKMEIASVGAYVVFTQIQTQYNGYMKFIPEIHISNITSSVVFDGLLPLVIALATDTLLDGQYWKAQFSDLSDKAGANIGNLVDDIQTQTPWKCENLQQRDTFINSFCEPPVLLLDIAEGRAKIPGLEMYTIPECNANIVQTYNNFLGQQVIPTTSVIGSLICKEYVGLVKNGPEYYDSRWCDYLNMIVNHTGMKTQCRALLSHQTREDDRANIVKQFFPDVSFHYMNHLILLRPEIIRQVQNIVHNRVRIVNGTILSGSIDYSQLLTAGKGYLQMPQGIGFYQAQTTPFQQIYNPNTMYYR